MATVKHRVGPNGDHELGVEDGGTFVVFTSMTDARFRSLAEGEDDRKEREKAASGGSRGSRSKSKSADTETTDEKEGGE